MKGDYKDMMSIKKDVNNKKIKRRITNKNQQQGFMYR